MGVADRVHLGGHFSAALGRASTSPASQLMHNNHHPITGVTLWTCITGLCAQNPGQSVNWRRGKERGYAPESPRLLLVMLKPVAEASGTITSAAKTTHARIESFIGLVDPI